MYKQPSLAPTPYYRQTVTNTSRHIPNPSKDRLNDPTKREPNQSPFTQYAKPKQPEHWFPQAQYNNNYNPEQHYQMTPSYPEENYPPYNANQSEHIPYFDTTSYYNEQYSGLPQSFQQANEPGAMQGQVPPQENNQLLSQFQKDSGQLDVDKMLNTIGQLANTYHQVAPIVKQFGSLMRIFR